MKQILVKIFYCKVERPCRLCSVFLLLAWSPLVPAKSTTHCPTQPSSSLAVSFWSGDQQIWGGKGREVRHVFLKLAFLL